MTFDITESNTGHKSAACISVQLLLNRPLLWSGCRHHIGEVILSHVFQDLQIETSQSPDITVFSKFRTNFRKLPQTCSLLNLSRFDKSIYSPEACQFLEDNIHQVLHAANVGMNRKRDDCREFAELCLLFLNSAEIDKTVKFKKPGAVHRARWLAKLLYSIKMCLLQKQIEELPRGTITAPNQMKKIQEFVIFVTTIYSHWWMTCTSAVDASWNDLQLYHRVLRYELVNLQVTKSAIRALNRHLWYLTSEMVTLALFSNNVPNEVRRQLADRLLALKPSSKSNNNNLPQNRFGTGFGKPKFPTNISLSTTLADLAGPDSWFTFDILHMNSDFLKEDVTSWSSLASYQQSLENTLAINVVNDSAERCIKFSSNFLHAVKMEDQYQNILQVVDRDRIQHPNIRTRRTKKQL